MPSPLDEGEWPGCGVLFLGVVFLSPLVVVSLMGVIRACLGVLPTPLPFVGVVCVLPGGGVAPSSTGDLLVLVLDTFLTGDTFGEDLGFFFSTLKSS